MSYVCESCGQDMRKMHPDFRARMEDGRMAHLEMDPKTGATILRVEDVTPRREQA